MPVGLRRKADRLDDGKSGSIPRLPIVQDPAQQGGHRTVGRLDGMGVHPQGHGRIGMAETIGDSPDVMPAGDRHGGRPVPRQICEESAPPLEPEPLSEQLLCDHDPLDLVGALVDLGARFRGSSRSPRVR